MTLPHLPALRGASRDRHRDASASLPHHKRNAASGGDLVGVEPRRAS